MTLIKSISGIRGTIGGNPGDSLTPIDVVKFVSAFANFTQGKFPNQKIKVVVGRDARISGEMVQSLVNASLVGMGCNVVDIGLASTPTTEIAVTEEKAHGGIIITASHNPGEWNALKMLNEQGEFLNASEGEQILQFAENESFQYAEIDEIGNISEIDYTDQHIEMVKQLELVDIETIKKANFKVAIDAVNSVGGIIIPRLLKELGVESIVEINCNPTGIFAHVPEPIPQNLQETAKIVKESDVDVAFVVDPDADRLAIMNEDGSLFNEEYTLVAIADYILSKQSGNTVSNLSSSRALADITEKHGGTYQAAAVGEVNVVAKMRETNAIIGGEGNGGVIYPESHCGRDAMVGIALFLTYLAKKEMKCSELRATYPNYFISKNKIQLTPEIDVDAILVKVKEKYASEKVNDIDGVKIDFTESWVHLRKSNTEPIIRIYAEAKSEEASETLAKDIIKVIESII